MYGACGLPRTWAAEWFSRMTTTTWSKPGTAAAADTGAAATSESTTDAAAPSATFALPDTDRLTVAP